MKTLRRSCVLLAACLAAISSAAESATFDLSTASIADIQAAIDAGALSSEKLVELYLARIEAYDQHGPKINAVITTNPRAVEIARALDTERKTKGKRSQLHGIPIVAKDLINTADMPTSGGFIAMKGAIPADDANVIRRLRDAGAIVFAKTNMSDWLGRSRADGGSSLAGQVINPYDLSRTIAARSWGSRRLKDSSVEAVRWPTRSRTSASVRWRAPPTTSLRCWM